MIDQLDPRAETWKRPATERLSIADHPAYWRHLAETDFRDTPRLAAEYRRLADQLERYLPLRGGASCES